MSQAGRRAFSGESMLLVAASVRWPERVRRLLPVASCRQPQSAHQSREPENPQAGKDRPTEFAEPW